MAGRFWIIVFVSALGVYALCGNVYAVAGMSFGGSVDLDGQALRINLTPEEGSSVDVAIQRRSDERSDFIANIRHLRIGLFAVTTELSGSFEAIRSGNDMRVIRGALRSQYSLINYKPVDEVAGSFRIQDGRIYLQSLSWGSFLCEGYIGLVPPHEIAVTFSFDEAQASDLALFLGCAAGEGQLSGAITGAITISGFFDRTMVRGHIVARDGFIDKTEYGVFRASFEGLYPTVYFSDSSFIDANGLSFNVGGSLYLGDHCDITRGMSGLTMSPVIYDGAEMREWTIRRREESSTRSSALKYRIRKQDKGILSLEEDDGMLGVEGRIKF